MEHVFQVQGMTCGHCEKAVQQAIRQVDPQAQVQIDRPQGRVAVHSQAAADALKAAIRDEGYAVA